MSKLLRLLDYINHASSSEITHLYNILINKNDMPLFRCDRAISGECYNVDCHHFHDHSHSDVCVEKYCGLLYNPVCIEIEH